MTRGIKSREQEQSQSCSVPPLRGVPSPWISQVSVGPVSPPSSRQLLWIQLALLPHPIYCRPLQPSSSALPKQGAAQTHPPEGEGGEISPIVVLGLIFPSAAASFRSVSLQTSFEASKCPRGQCKSPEGKQLPLVLTFGLPPGQGASMTSLGCHS